MKQGRERLVIVDADACPVKQEIVRTARKFGISTLMVASYDHRLQPEDGVMTVQVDRSDQSADLYIANRIAAGDILVTQDYGLAALGLGKRAHVISNHGHQFHEETIENMLAQRHHAAKLRRGGKHTKGPKPFTDEDRQRFLHTLTKVLQSVQEYELR